MQILMSVFKVIFVMLMLSVLTLLGVSFALVELDLLEMGSVVVCQQPYS